MDDFCSDADTDASPDPEEVNNVWEVVEELSDKLEIPLECAQLNLRVLSSFPWEKVHAFLGLDPDAQEVVRNLITVRIHWDVTCLRGKLLFLARSLGPIRFLVVERSAESRGVIVSRSLTGVSVDFDIESGTCTITSVHDRNLEELRNTRWCII
jgi:hypothetical protein